MLPKMSVCTVLGFESLERIVREAAEAHRPAGAHVRLPSWPAAATKAALVEQFGGAILQLQDDSFRGKKQKRPPGARAVGVGSWWLSAPSL